MPNKLDFNRVFAKNFLPFGPEGIDVDISSLSNIVVVKGTNYDAQADGKDSSNGSGKSSFPEIIVYALYGKCIKEDGKLTHSDVMHYQASKGMVVGCEVNDYRITRRREPNSLTVEQLINGEWEDQTRSTMTETQKMITEEVIGLTYESFCSIFVFTDNQSTCFLHADGPTKKQIIENVSGLEVYRALNECAKKIKRELNATIKTHVSDVQHVVTNRKNALQRLQHNKTQEEIWKSQKRAEMQLTAERIGKLKNSDSAYTEELKKYELDKAKIPTLETQISSLEKKRESIVVAHAKAIEMSQDYENETKAKNDIITKCMMAVSQIKGTLSAKKEQTDMIQAQEDVQNAVCPTCERPFDPESFNQTVEKINKAIEKCKIDIEKIENKKNEFNNEAKEIVAKQQQVSATIASIEKSLADIDKGIESIKQEVEKLTKLEKPSPKSDSDIELRMLEERLEEMKTEYTSKSPYFSILANCAQELAEAEQREKDKVNELELAEEALPDIDFWIKAFAPDGIRKLIIEDMLPALNAKAAFWLEILTNGAYSIKFDDAMDPIIAKQPTKDKNLKFGLLSGGQRRNVNLAVSQALAYITTVNRGVLPGLVFLDEVTLNLDPITVRGVYAMIQELSKHRRVFVTTHEQELQCLLEGCDTIHFEHRNGITTIKNG